MLQLVLATVFGLAIPLMVALAIGWLALRRYFRSYSLNRLAYAAVAGYALLCIDFLLHAHDGETLARIVAAGFALMAFPLWCFTIAFTPATGSGGYASFPPRA